MKNYISDEYKIVFNQHSSTDAVVEIHAPTNQEIVSIRSLLYVGLSYFNTKLAYSWECEEGFIDPTEYVFNKVTQTLPLGLIPRAVSYLQERNPNLKVKISPEVTRIYKNPSGNVTPDGIRSFCDTLQLYNESEDVKIVPYDHQIKIVERAINGRRISLMACTSAGKSLSMCILSRYLLTVEKKRMLIVTPSSALVIQLYSDFFDDYGWKDAQKNCTLIYGESEDKLTAKQKKYLAELNLGEESMLKPIAISTWQSLQGKLSPICPSCKATAKKKSLPKCVECAKLVEAGNAFFNSFTAVMVDEAHGTRGPILRQILDKCTNAVDFKIGVSGTLPDDGLDAAWIEGALGRKEEIVRLKHLVSLGILTPVEVFAIKIPYREEIRAAVCRETYQGEYSLLTSNSSRENVMRILIDAGRINLEQNTVILYKNKATLHAMHEYLKEAYPQFKYHIIVGDVLAVERDDIRKLMEKSTGNIIIATYGTMKQGVNIKLLHNLVFAEFSKSMYEIVQSIGRIVRRHKDKKNATVFDIFDDCSYMTKPRSSSGYSKLVENYSVKHYRTRTTYYANDEIPVTEFDLSGIYEGDVDYDAVKARKLAAKKASDDKAANKKTATPKAAVKGKGGLSKFLT